MKKQNVVISLSGGMDSSTLLLKALNEYENVTAISFDYGQKHRVELERARSLVQYINRSFFTRIPVKSRPGGYDPDVPVRYRVIKLDGLAGLLNSTLVEGGDDVPEGHYEQENMVDTVVPNRNKIFSSIIQAIALSVAKKTGESCDIALGIHAGDHCFSKTTEILTPTGLKTIEELEVGEEVYSFNLEKNTWELDKVTDLYKKGVVDSIVRIETRAGALELTDEHKVYRLALGDFNSSRGYSKYIEKVKVGDLKEGDFLIQASSLKGDDTLDSNSLLDLLPIVETISRKYEKGLTLQEENSKLWLGGTSEKYKALAIPRFVKVQPFLNVLAWYIAEGWSQKDPYKVRRNGSRYSASFSQSLKANLEKVDLILRDLSDSGLVAKFEFSKHKHNNIPAEVTFFLSNISALLLKEAGSHSTVKHIPGWALELLYKSQELRESFLDTLQLADGFKNGEQTKGFCSTSDLLLKQVVTLLQLSGYHFSIERNPKRITKYVYYFKLSRKAALVSLGEAKFTEIIGITEQPYEDHVYDITVEKNHNFLAGSLGALLISNSIYPDCREEFRDADDKAFRLGNWGADAVGYWTPYLHTDKYGILQDGESLCKALSLDFDEVYSRTNTSYKPIEFYDLEKDESVWFSDFKSASSVERVESFIKLGRPDPVRYADEEGEVSWEEVVKHVKKVLMDHKPDKE